MLFWAQGRQVGKNKGKGRYRQGKAGAGQYKVSNNVREEGRRYKVRGKAIPNTKATQGKIKAQNGKGAMCRQARAREEGHNMAHRGHRHVAIPQVKYKWGWGNKKKGEGGILSKGMGAGNHKLVITTTREGQWGRAMGEEGTRPGRG